MFKFWESRHSPEASMEVEQRLGAARGRGVCIDRKRTQSAIFHTTPGTEYR
jgi:hypothetical protein